MATSRTLILMRHAAAGHGGAQRDHDRPLTPGGTRDAAAAGEWIRDHLPEVDSVLCSTAVRARQTLAATMVGAVARFADELYGGGIDDILGQIAVVPGSARTVLVVGHAPGVPSLAVELATVASLAQGADDPEGVPDVDVDGSIGRPELEDLRHFSACALAVLTTRASWDQLADQGAELVTVHHPDR